MGESAYLDEDLVQALRLLRRYFGHVKVLSSRPRAPAQSDTGGPRSCEAGQANLFDDADETDGDRASGRLTAGAAASDSLPVR